MLTLWMHDQAEQDKLRVASKAALSFATFGGQKMNRTTRRILWLGIPTAALVALASPFLIPLAMFAPLVVKDICLSFSETAETIREGDAYGFRVGDTKEHTFAAAGKLLEKGDFGWLRPWADRDTYYEVYPHEVGFT